MLYKRHKKPTSGCHIVWRSNFCKFRSQLCNNSLFLIWFWFKLEKLFSNQIILLKNNIIELLKEMFNLPCNRTRASNVTIFMKWSTRPSAPTIEWARWIDVGKRVPCTESTSRYTSVWSTSSVFEDLIIGIYWPAVVQNNKFSFWLVSIKLLVVECYEITKELWNLHYVQNTYQSIYWRASKPSC